MPKIQTLTIKDFSWINIVDAKKEEIEYLKRKFKFHPLDLADTYGSQYAQRPKLNLHNDYLFVILQFPYYNRQSREVTASEIDFYIGRDFFITAHTNVLPPLVDFFKNCQADIFYAQQYEILDPASLLYEILNRLLTYCLPMLDHLSMDIGNIEKNIFAGHERYMVKEILYIKRNIINFRKIMQAHKGVIYALLHINTKYFYTGRLKEYYDNLIDRTKNIWDILQNQKETIDALEGTNTSLVSFQLNDIIRTLTIVSVTIFIMTFIATLFAVGPLGGMPFINSTYGFWIVVIIIGVAATITFHYLRKKRW